ncbi:hypothetical protein AWB78_08510 [Caballeronia calidae]|uniref:HEAT repeat protein n=1 Tax=Caballeronia calidae TaxID=1777139 RepID=A0A158ELN7_9BURK|nr:hypothetical protein [Caballeronia calidae]SAL07276.1 hypothetical protein AWB78_08510 [Caballeronia calidae]
MNPSFLRIKTHLRQDVSLFLDHGTQKEILKTKNRCLLAIPSAKFKFLNELGVSDSHKNTAFSLATSVLNANPNIIDSADAFVKALEFSCALGEEAIDAMLSRFNEVPAEQTAKVIKLLLARFSKDDNRGLPSSDLVYGVILAELSRDLSRFPEMDRAPVFNSVLRHAKTLHRDGCLALLCALPRAVGDLPEDARAAAFQILWEEAGFCDDRTRHVPLPNLVDNIRMLPDSERPIAFHNALIAVSKLDSKVREPSLRQLAHNIHFCHKPNDRKAVFDAILDQVSILDCKTRRNPLAKLAQVTPYLPKNNRKAAFDSVLKQIGNLENDARGEVLSRLMEASHWLPDEVQLDAFSNVLKEAIMLKGQVLTELPKMISGLSEQDMVNALQQALACLTAFDDKTQEYIKILCAKMNM